MATSTITKTVLTEPRTVTTIAADVTAKTTAHTITTALGVTVFIDYAPDASAAKVGNGTRFKIQTSQTTTADLAWRDLFVVQTGVSSPNTGSLSSATTAGGTVINTTSTLPALGAFAFFKSTTVANNEWAEVVARSTGSSTFTVLDGVTTALTTNTTWYDSALHWQQYLNATGIVRWRVVAHNNMGTTNQAAMWHVAAIEGQNINATS